MERATGIEPYVRLLAARFGEPGYGPIGDLLANVQWELRRLI